MPSVSQGFVLKKILLLITLRERPNFGLPLPPFCILILNFRKGDQANEQFKPKKDKKGEILVCVIMIQVP